MLRMPVCGPTKLSCGSFMIFVPKPSVFGAWGASFMSDLPKLTNFRILSVAQLIFDRTMSVRELIRAR